MAYSQAIVQRAMQRLQSENEQNEQSSRARIAAIYEKQPRLGEIDRELRRTAAHVLAATFRRQGDRGRHAAAEKGQSGPSAGAGLDPAGRGTGARTI